MLNRRNLSLAAGMATAIALTAGAIITSTGTASADEAVGPAIGAAAPGFTGTNSNGEEISLSDFNGQTVVLEWTNADCPFVKKHYDASVKNMQGLQTDAADDDIG